MWNRVDRWWGGRWRSFRVKRKKRLEKKIKKNKKIGGGGRFLSPPSGCCHGRRCFVIYPPSFSSHSLMFSPCPLSVVAPNRGRPRPPSSAGWNVPPPNPHLRHPLLPSLFLSFFCRCRVLYPDERERRRRCV